MSVDFGGTNEEATIGSLIFDAMRTHMVGLIGKMFANYVRRHRAEKRLLFSHYVIRDRNRPNKVIALTVAPAGDYWTRRCPTPGGQKY
jgi:hypothetical protein